GYGGSLRAPGYSQRSTIVYSGSGRWPFNLLSAEPLTVSALSAFAPVTAGMARVRDYRREQSPDRGLHGQRLNRETSRYAGRAAFHRPRGPATAVPSHPPGLGGDETGHGQVT